VISEPERLRADIAGLLDGIRSSLGGRYACVLEPAGIRFESPAAADPGTQPLRRRLADRARDLFALPARLQSDAEPIEDLFEGCAGDELLLAILNERVALVLDCPDAEAAREAVRKPLLALADRLFRFNPAWRMDRRGRGFFFGRPKLELVVIGRPGEPGATG
jgi:hypothetical protein